MEKIEKEQYDEAMKIVRTYQKQRREEATDLKPLLEDELDFRVGGEGKWNIDPYYFIQGGHMVAYNYHYKENTDIDKELNQVGEIYNVKIRYGKR